MNRYDAKTIAEDITNEQLKQMFDTAKAEIKNWEKVSNVNKSFSKGTAWNILVANFDINHNYHILAKINMIREFGEYLPNKLKPRKKEKRIEQKPVHQKPIFD